jgi:hypothetical protein
MVRWVVVVALMTESAPDLDVSRCEVATPHAVTLRPLPKGTWWGPAVDH